MAKPRSKPQLSLDDAPFADDQPGIPEDHWCRAFYEYIYMAFDDADFADMYEEGGRYPISPRFLACITILQYVFEASDRKAVEKTIMRRDWRIALGIDTKTYTGFHPTVLTGFRQRLAEHGRERELFERVLDVLREHGLLKDRRRVRVDSTHLLADVSRRSRIDAITEAMRLVVCELADNYPELFENTAFCTLYEHYSQRGWLGTTSGDDELLIELARDAKTLLKLCEGRDVEQREVLQRIIDDNFAFDDDGEPDPDGSDTPRKDRMTTPHDPDARVGKKRSKTWLGNKVHITETTDPDLPNLIVDFMVTDPQRTDSDVLQEIAQRTAFRLPGVQFMTADGGYYSSRNSKRAAEAGMELISPPLPDPSKNPVPPSEFDFDFKTQIATCPEGYKSISWRRYGEGRDETLHVRFSVKDCRNCDLWGKCVKKGNQGRHLGLASNYEQLSRDRAKAQQPWFWQLYSSRGGVEGTISDLVRTCGFRRSRYPENDGRLLHTGLAMTALNVKRALPYLGKQKATGDPPQPAAAVGAGLPARNEVTPARSTA